MEYASSGLVKSTRVPKEIQKKFDELKAIEKQREKQQGLGRPIISAFRNGVRFVAVGNRLFHSSNYKTFHDFLFNYIASVFGEEWGNAEIKKPLEERHPILQWYNLLCKFQRENWEESQNIQSASMTGAVAAYLRLSYNLYLLAHNEEIQNILIERLKHPEQFFGALYETHVAAVLIKAGFELDFENEEDGSRSHCEFTATYKGTGKQFSVEAKARQPGKCHYDVGNQLYSALRKQADHKRIVFIELNSPDTSSAEEMMANMAEAVSSLRTREPTLKIGAIVKSGVQRIDQAAA